jgi:hypothetical protein
MRKKNGSRIKSVMAVHMIEFNGSVQMDFIIGARKQQQQKKKECPKLRVVKNGTNVEVSFFSTTKRGAITPTTRSK